MQRMLARFKSFLSNKSGNFAVTASLIAVPLLAGGGYATDYMIMKQQYSTLQDAADAAALASARELALPGANQAMIQSTVESYINVAFANSDMISGETASLQIETVTDFSADNVTVNLSYAWTPFVVHFFNNQATPIRVSAKAGLTSTNSSLLLE